MKRSLEALAALISVSLVLLCSYFLWVWISNPQGLITCAEIEVQKKFPEAKSRSKLFPPVQETENGLPQVRLVMDTVTPFGGPSRNEYVVRFDPQDSSVIWIGTTNQLAAERQAASGSLWRRALEDHVQQRPPTAAEKTNVDYDLRLRFATATNEPVEITTRDGRRIR